MDSKGETRVNANKGGQTWKSKQGQRKQTTVPGKREKVRKERVNAKKIETRVPERVNANKGSTQTGSTHPEKREMLRKAPIRQTQG